MHLQNNHYDHKQTLEQWVFHSQQCVCPHIVVRRQLNNAFLGRTAKLAASTARHMWQISVAGPSP